MKKSIEEIWKEGFLNDKSMVAPKINDLYSQKSKHVVNQIEGIFRTHVIAIIVMSVVFPIIHYFLDAVWQGVATSVLLLFSAWYSVRQGRSIKAPDQGATSLDYLKSFDRWLKDALSRGEKILRFTYPLYFLIALSTIWSAWNKRELASRMYQEYPDVTAIGRVPILAWIITGAATLLMFYFSGRIYRWDIRLVYGRVFDKLEEIILEMEKLKKV